MSVVGIDGGQSQVRLAMCGEDNIRTAPGVSHSMGDTVDRILEVIARLWQNADSDVSRVVAGLTTIPADDATRRKLAEGLAQITGASEAWVCNDSVTFHASALGGGSGVALAVGTGVACLAVDAEHGTHRSFDGAGYLLGDEGGGFWIGRHGIRAALASADGRGPHTTLVRAVVERLGPLDDLAVRLHSNPRAVDTIARAAMLVGEEQVRGDDVAGTIISTAIARLTATVSAALEYLGRSRDSTVSIGGRVAKMLGEPLLASIRSAVPSANPAFSERSGLEGACFLACQEGAGPYSSLVTAVGRPL